MSNLANDVACSVHKWWSYAITKIIQASTTCCNRGPAVGSGVP